MKVDCFSVDPIYLRLSGILNSFFLGGGGGGGGRERCKAKAPFSPARVHFFRNLKSLLLLRLLCCQQDWLPQDKLVNKGKSFEY